LFLLPQPQLSPLEVRRIREEVKGVVVPPIQEVVKLVAAPLLVAADQVEVRRIREEVASPAVAHHILVAVKGVHHRIRAMGTQTLSDRRPVVITLLCRMQQKSNRAEDLIKLRRGHTQILQEKR
jgi:hypothetical protein